jgi:tRNA 5-methylaminomethyl-2-thiouridine biosynthesis bifunctional protein
MDPTASEAGSPLVWREDGLPQSSLYGDVYFSSVDGLAETRAVFLAGCGLPERFSERRDFVVGELGFGSGLNIAALLDLWRREKPPNGQQVGKLHVFSIEAHPLARDEAARILAHWPELGEAAQVLLDHWPGRARGFHRIDLPGFDAVLDLAVMDVVEALEAWDGAADAWFLDGFSPALNPAMWRDEVLAAVAARSAPGARAATFTVAGAVRRGLQAAGFEIAKRPGFGRKRERLEAWLPGVRELTPRPETLAIIGGGVAGASLARAARAEGLAITVIDDPDGVAASGNPAALVTPALDAGGGPRTGLYAQALARAAMLYEAEPGAVIARGVLQLATAERDAARFAKVAEQDLFEPGAMVALSPDQTAGRIGAEIPALAMTSSLVIAPPVVTAAWTGEVVRRRVARLERDGPNEEGDGWRLLDEAGALIARADRVALASGAATAALLPGVALRPVRGQASWTEGVSTAPVAFGGYAIPTSSGVLFGATHDRDETTVDVRPEDHARNLDTLAKGLPALARQLAGKAFEGRAALRATTPDRAPLAGIRDDGVLVLTGLGSRGFCLAPLLAEHLVARMLDLPSPLPRHLSHPLDPSRFDSPAASIGV